jgi:two-component system C4-dicarboxylate transport response regulator DctD
MPLTMQIKLLRVLQDRQVERLGSNERRRVDVRVIAATKDDLLQRSREQTFRADLYYRLNVVTIDLPPLRERREDIALLMEHFLLLAASRYQRPPPTLTAAQLNRLKAHDWPGNVRELKNVADCLVLGVRQDLLADLPAPTSATPLSLAEAVEQFERQLIAEELRRQGGHIGRSAKALNTPKTTLADKIRKYGLSSAEG